MVLKRKNSRNSRPSTARLTSSSKTKSFAKRENVLRAGRQPFPIVGIGASAGGREAFTEQDSCLLGTDAVRDGVDVPGRSLRILAFDRVPWPRPDLLHKARRLRFGGEGAGGRNFDDALARAKMAQAFGRLIRRADDKGVFVMLDAAAPTRLFASLPPGTEVQRMGLADAVEQVGAFLC